MNMQHKPHVLLMALTTLTHAYVEFPSSCIGQEDGYQWLKPLEGDDFPPVLQKCDREYMIIDASHDDNILAYLTSTEQYRADTLGPAKSSSANWEQWFLPNAAFLTAEDTADLAADEYFSYTLSPDCNSCLNSVFDTVDNRLSQHNDDEFGDHSAYYMTGATFGCQSLSEQIHMASLACSTDASECAQCDGEMGLCAAYPHSAYTSKVPQSTEECVSGELSQRETLKPAMGNDGENCVCYRPNKGYDRELKWRTSPASFEDYKAERLLTQQSADAEDTLAVVGVSQGVVELYQEDFAKGTLRIRQSGTYKIMEDIAFDFNAGDLTAPNEGSAQWWPMAEQSAEYPGAGTERDEYFMGFFAGITIEVDDVVIDLNGFEIAMAPAFYYQQRFFSGIALKSTVYDVNEPAAPGMFGSVSKYAQNVVIKDGSIGLSSHHGIHGQNNEGVTIDVHVHSFETHGIEMSGFSNLNLNNVEIGPSSQASTVLRVQTDDNRASELSEVFSIMFVTRASEQSLEDIISTLRTSMNIAFKTVMNIDHTSALRLFINADGLPTGGSLYGLFLNQETADILGPAKSSSANWEQWFVPNAAFLGDELTDTLSADEYFSYTLSPDYSSCLNSVFDTVDNRLSQHNDDDFGDRSAYYMTGATFGCQSLSEQIHMASLACSTDRIVEDAKTTDKDEQMASKKDEQNQQMSEMATKPLSEQSVYTLAQNSLFCIVCVLFCLSLVCGATVCRSRMSFVFVVWTSQSFQCRASSYGNWTTGSSTLPRGANGVVVGYSESTDTVWLLGGSGYWNQLVSFDLSSQSFTDYNVSALSHNAKAAGQSYAQLDQFLYFVGLDDGNGPSNIIHRFNVDTGAEDGYSTTIMNGQQLYRDTRMCLAALDADDGYLFVVGGKENDDSAYLRNTFILNLGSNQWFEGPSLNTVRGFHACAIPATQNMLFAIGGSNTDSIEYLNIGDMANINSYEWAMIYAVFPIYARLSFGGGTHRAVIYGTDILIIGGNVRNMNVINTVDLTVKQSGDLGIALRYPAPVVVDSMAYNFGGWPDSAGNTWRYLLLTPTSEPTKQPTKEPTSDPTQEPTTSDPTTIPTATPTFFCPALLIDVSLCGDLAGFDDELYQFQPNARFGKPVWQTQSGEDIYSIDGSWIIEGRDGSLFSLEMDSMFPPIANYDLTWTHSLSSTNIHCPIPIECIGSWAPTETPTAAPTRAEQEEFKFEHFINLTFVGNYSNQSCLLHFGSAQRIHESEMAIVKEYVFMLKDADVIGLSARVDSGNVSLCSESLSVQIVVAFTVLSSDKQRDIQRQYDVRSEFFSNVSRAIESLFGRAATVSITVVQLFVIEGETVDLLTRYLSASISAVFIVAFSVLSLIGWAHKKATFKKAPNMLSTSPFHAVDSVKYVKILSFGMSVLSAVIALYLAYSSIAIGDAVSIGCGSCLVLVLMCSTIANLFELSLVLKGDILNNSAKIWLSNHFKGVFVLVCLSGSLCKSINFSSCALMGLNAMLCPLDAKSDANLFAFHVKFVLLMRCLPELVLEGLFMYLNINDAMFTFISGLSMLWSLINLSAGIAEAVQYRTHRTEHIRTFALSLTLVNVEKDANETDRRRIGSAMYYFASFGRMIADKYYGVEPKFVRVHECLVDLAHNVIKFRGTVDDRALVKNEDEQSPISATGTPQRCESLSESIVTFLDLKQIRFAPVQSADELFSAEATSVFDFNSATTQHPLSDHDCGKVQQLATKFEMMRIVRDDEAGNNPEVMRKMRELIKVEIASKQARAQ